ncbi:MAG: RNA polymerase sigma factor, partial [Chloroflexi bacterium]|nr:RNA polymerase sigma factor [Chloroflexota bacterium]
MSEAELQDLLRQLAPRVLGALVRRYGHFDTAEDATQEALIAAATTWPTQGQPEHPLGWLITVASRRLTDELRSEQARQRRQEAAAPRIVTETLGSALEERSSDPDDTLILLFMCCHPALSVASQIALTLRAVGGLNTLEIARAFLVPEATMTRRITRAKQTIKDSGIPFRMPSATERGQRLSAVLHVLYLIFNEGYASSSGSNLYRTDLSAEAIRLCRGIAQLMPHEAEVTGLLALMLLTDARRAARAGATGEVILMAEQDRRLWNAAYIAEGIELVTRALQSGKPGQYQLQAAIAALHDEAPSFQATDWPQIVALYEVLLAAGANPVVQLNHAAAVGMARGPKAGLSLLEELRADARLADDYRLFAVRAHLLRMAGETDSAHDAYIAAAERAPNLAQQRNLYAQAARCADD